MPGIGQPDISPLAVGTSAQPLVSPMEPVVTPDSVKALTDAVHSGIISAVDISNRIGAVGQAEKKAHLQALSEYVRPESIQSRLEQVKAQQAQAQLQSAQAGAALPLVRPQSDLLSLQLAQKQAATVYGEDALTSLQKLGPSYGVSVEQFKDPATGQVDFKKASQKGLEISAQNNIINSWFQQLSPIGTRETVDTSGQKHIAQLNAAGQDVSPPSQQPDGSFYPGSPQYWHVVDQLNSMMPKTHPLRGIIPTVHPGDQAALVSPGVPVVATGPSRTLVTPGNEARFRGEYAVELNNRGANGPVESTKLPIEAIQAWVDNKYPPSEVAVTPLPAPVPTPAPAPAPAPAPTLGVPTAGGPIVKPAQTPEEQRKEITAARASVAALPDVGEYYKAVPTFLKFADSAKRAPIARNGATDLGLAENYSKMHDPQSTIREFKFDALKEVIPLLERFKDAAPLINKSHIFPDNVRQAIIEDGMRLADATEKGIVPSLVAAERTLPGTLNEEQRAIVNGVPFSQRVGHSFNAAPAASSGETGAVHVGGRKLVPIGNGQYRVVQ